MEATVSVSKGVFLFKNGFKRTKKPANKERPLFEKWFKQEPWYAAYRSNWRSLQGAIQEVNNKTYRMLINDIVNYIKSFSNDQSCMEGVVPSATLLTGVNQPDHVSQFAALIAKIREEVTPHIAMVASQDAPSLKHMIENTVWQLMHGDENLMCDDEDLDDSIRQTQSKRFRKGNCTMTTLRKWFTEMYRNKSTVSPKKKKLSSTSTTKPLVVIMPDFESFNCSVLQDFVMITSSYMSSLPIIFVFGVATSVSALHKSFPYHVSSKLLIKVFHSHSSPVYMNQVLEDIFLTHTSPFHLSGKAFELLTDVFLFYDFSVSGLIQSIKYCMMEHYYGDNIKSLCCDRAFLDEAIMNLTAEALENIRRLPSFRPFVESQDCRTKISLFEDDNFFKESLVAQMGKLHDYLYSFYACLRLFSAFVKDLPKNVLGKSVREMYTKCASAECVTASAAFKECMQLLKFQSQVKLVDSIKGALKVISTTLLNAPMAKPPLLTPTKNNLLRENALDLGSSLGENFLKTVRVHLLTFQRHIQNASTEATILASPEADEDFSMENTPTDRYKLKEKLLKATRVDKVQSQFEMIRSRLTSYLEEVFTKGLQPPQTQTFYEIFFFSDVTSVKKQIIGSPRGAVHTALSNPEHYIQCSCCILPSPESLSDTLPDVCLAYKLHRECGRHINLYDWLQAFAAVLAPADEDEERRHVPPDIQARFTRSVAELQFLGFIKSSKRKTDHVMRLTW